MMGDWIAEWFHTTQALNIVDLCLLDRALVLSNYLIRNIGNFNTFS